MKTLQKKVAEKLFAVRAKILKGNKHFSNRSVQLSGDILLDLGFAARDGRLASTFVRSFLFSDRSEILCQILQRADAALKANNTRFGLKRASWGLSDEEMWIRKNILRLTMEEILEEYGIEHYHICGKKIYPQDVLYARFLNEHGLGHRKGAEITEKDLPPIEGDDVFARRETFIRIALDMPVENCI